MSIFLAPAGELTVSPNHLGVIGSTRGGLLDTDALYDALVSGQIAGAAVDVTEPEPLENDALKNENDVRLHKQERCIVRKEVVPRPPRIHVDGSLYHAEKTKNERKTGQIFCCQISPWQ